MSNGGEECKVTQNSENELGGDDFALAIGRIAVAKICDGTGSQGFHQSALNTLSYVTVRYICQTGKLANLYANLSGRSESNALDIIQGLENLGLPQGFSGASNTGQCLASSGIVREIAHYVNDANDNFAYLVPSFPVVRDQKRVLSLAQVKDSSRGEHIPTWLPAFPDSHSYFQEREVDKGMEKIEPLKQKGKVNKSMLNLQQHMSCNGSEAPIAVDTGDAAKANSSLFLSPPLKFGEREVSSVVISPNLLNGDAIRERENDGMLFELFSPVAKPMKSLLKDSEEIKEKVILNTRPTVQFKLMSFKKSLSLKIDEIEQVRSMFGDNSNKHERKMIAEQIVDESMDLVQEPAEL